MEEFVIVHGLYHEKGKDQPTLQYKKMALSTFKENYFEGDGYRQVFVGSEESCDRLLSHLSPYDHKKQVETPEEFANVNPEKYYLIEDKSH